MAKRRKGMPEHNRDLASVGYMDAPEEVGNRLFKIRCVAGYGAHGKQKAFADKLGFGLTNYNNWEVGRPIPVDAAIKICEWTGDNVTLDYIFRGIGRGTDWFARLEAAPDRSGFVAPPQSPRAPPPRRRG